MPESFFTDKEHIRRLDTFREIYLVSAILWYVITEAGRFICRPYIYSNDINTNNSLKTKFMKTTLHYFRNYLCPALIIAFLCLNPFSPLSAQDWLQIGSDIGGKQDYESFGYHVAMSSDGYTVAAGAVYHDTEFDDAGAARVYSWNGSAWVQKGNDFTGSAEDDEYGYSIALSDDGNVVAIGAKEDSDDKQKPGYAQVFSWNGSAWEQMGDNLVGNDAYDLFGCNICCSADGSIVAVASRNSPIGEEAGSVMVFEWTGSSWIQKGDEILGNAEWDFFGSSSVNLSADGNILAAGSCPSAVAGYVRTYEWNGTAWEQRGSQLNGDDIADGFGCSTSLSDDGNTLAVGVKSYDVGVMNRGQVKVYTWNGSDWAQKGNAIVGPDENAFLGWSVCISADGNSYLAGMPAFPGHEFSNGRVRVYEYDGSSWLQKGAEIQGLAENDRCGYALEISADGGKILLGAPWHSGMLSGEGQLRIFTYGHVGIPDQDPGSVVKVSPNPVTDHIHIDLGKICTNVKFSLRNISGQLISSRNYQNVSEIRYEIDAPAGIYFIEMNDENNHSTLLKVVKY